VYLTMFNYFNTVQLKDACTDMLDA
jgi:hypothetical protein